MSNITFQINNPSTNTLLVNEFNQLAPTPSTNGGVYIEVFRIPAGDTTLPLEARLIVDLRTTNIEDGTINVYKTNTSGSPIVSSIITSNKEILTLHLGNEGHGDIFIVEFSNLSIAPLPTLPATVTTVLYEIDVNSPTENNTYKPILSSSQPTYGARSFSVEPINFVIKGLEVPMQLENIIEENMNQEDELLTRLRKLEFALSGLEVVTSSKDISILDKISQVENKLNKLATKPETQPAKKPTKKPGKKSTKKSGLKPNNKPKSSAVKNLVGVKVIKK